MSNHMYPAPHGKLSPTELGDEFRKRGLYQPGFKWRDRFGNYHLVTKMETRHVFYAWLLIWNFVAPEHLKSDLGQKYTSLGPSYTPLYCLEAFGNFYVELKHRKDILPRWAIEIEHIESYFYTRHGQPFDPDSFKAIPECDMEYGSECGGDN